MLRRRFLILQMCLAARDVRFSAQAPLALFGEAANEAVCGACELTTYDLTTLAAFRTFAQRSLCAAAMRSRASLLKIRLLLLR